jgi:hypothetical protein
LTSSSLYDMRITHEYFVVVDSDSDEPIEASEARLRSVQVGTTVYPATGYRADYEYSATTGRLDRVKGSGLPTGSPAQSHGAWYAFEADSNLIDKVEIKDAAATVLATMGRDYETYRDPATAYENKWGATGVSKCEYGYDLLGRPKYVTGAIIAACLAKGMQVREVRRQYENLASPKTPHHRPPTASWVRVTMPLSRDRAVIPGMRTPILMQVRRRCSVHVCGVFAGLPHMSDKIHYMGCGS